MTIPRSHMVLVLAAVFLVGCAGSPSKPPLASTAQITILTSVDPIEGSPSSDQGSFARSTLYSLLVAELAGHQGLPEVTLLHYLQEAKNTEDLGIIKRAVNIADYLDDDSSLLQATLLWAKVAPDDPEPFSIASNVLIRLERFEEAKPFLRRTLEFGGLDGVDVINTLVRHAGTMQATDRQAYLTLFNELLETAPDNVYYLFVKASLLTHNKQYEAALAASQKALISDPKYVHAVILVAELQDKLGHLDAAVSHLEDYLPEIERRRYRNHKEFRLLYTRLLMKKRQFKQADKQAEIIALKNRHDENILYYLGVLMLDYGRLESSERYFNLLPDLTGLTGELRYYFGRIAQLRGHRQQALDYFATVDDPRYLVASFNEVSNLLDQATDHTQLSSIFVQVRGEHPNYAPLLYGIESHWLVKHALSDSALTLLNEALVHYPDDVRLLHNRAMLWEKLNDPLKMEMDLRKLLKVHPNNLSPLDTLGYRLTDQPQSHNEAAGIFRSALETRPNDPAILDNMGWVLHNLGDLEGALYYLKKAYDIYPEPEIAAHLGTVYWKLGQTHLALKIWDKSLKEHPNRHFLNKFLAIADDNF